MKYYFFITICFCFVTAPAYCKSPALVEEVYEHLKEALSFDGLSYPHIEVLSEKENGASYDEVQNIIFIEEKLLDICAELKDLEDDALAVVLGHELSHFYQKHRWKGKSKACFLLDKKTSYRFGEINQEKEADIHGAFNAYLAGYKMDEVLPLLYGKMYESYGLKKELSGYPVFDERLETPELVLHELKGLIQLFESSNYLLSLGNYEKAMLGYDYIVNEVGFESVGLLNNMALVYLLGSFQFMAKDENNYAYPMELDWDSRINQPTFRSNEERRVYYFFRAGQYLDRALALSPTHITSLLNLACLEDLSGQSESALAIISQSNSLPCSPIEKLRFKMIEGIVYARYGKREKAETIFNRLVHSAIKDQQLQSYLQQNLKNLRGEYIASPFENEQREGRIFTEQIAGTDWIPIDPKKNANLFYYLKPDNGDAETTACYYYYSSTSEGFQSYYNATKESIKLQIVTDKSIKIQDEIGIGSTATAILQAFGKTQVRMLSASNGYIISHPKSALFFYIDKNDIVWQWGLCRFVD